MTSFDDCPMLTWSLGWIVRSSLREAIVAITSLAFMLVEVPEPVWKMSTGKCLSCLPCSTSRAAAWIASEMPLSRNPSSEFT